MTRDGKQGGRRSRRILTLGLIPLALAGVAWIVWHPREAVHHGRRFDAEAGGAIPVVVATAQRGDIPISRNALGTVTPLAAVTVRTQIAGQLMSVGFREGQMVKAGDFLAQIDPRPYQVQLEQYAGQLKRDQALLDNARADLTRYRTLAAQDSVARQTLDTQAALVHQYEGTVAADQAQVDSARLDLTYCHIVAPATGRVGLRQVDPGNYVQTSDTNGIVVLTQIDPISVLFSLPEDDLPAVQDRLRAGARLSVDAFDRSRSRHLATGHLETIDNEIDTTTGTVKLRALFDNPGQALFPNQFVNVTLNLDTLTGAVTVPGSAIQRGQPGTFVYLIRADNTVAIRPVALGPEANGRVAVTQGVEIGDRVVVDGADKLRDGAAVRIPDAEAVNGSGGTTPPKTDNPAENTRRPHRSEAP